MDATNGYALVTGASGGIGLEFARQLAADGWPVVLTGRNEATLAAARDALGGPAGHRVIPCDLSRPGAAVELHTACIRQGIAVELLVNNAGSGKFGDATGHAPADVEAMVNLNVSALTNLCALFGADMKKRGHGRILNVGSFVGLNATPYFAAYAATKSYVLSFSLALREELRHSGVGVTCLLPGYVRTGFDDSAGIRSERYKRFSKSNSLGPEAVARHGLEALERGVAYTIVGGRNRFAAALFGLLPRTTPPRIMKKFIDSLV
jgi:short-subunit dehydrogenase